MMDELVEWLKQIAVFMVLCETILSFSPTKTYKRYIKPFVGMILLFRISVFLFGAVEIDWNKRIEDVFVHYEESVGHYLENSTIVNEEKQNEMLNTDLIEIKDITIDEIRIGVGE